MVYLHNVCIDKFVFVFVIVFDFNSFPTFNDTFTCPSNKTNFNWAIATDNDLTDYMYLTRIYCKDIHVDDVVKCSDVNCKSHDHLKQIDDLYSQLCSVLCHLTMQVKVHMLAFYVIYLMYINLLF